MLMRKFPGFALIRLGNGLDTLVDVELADELSAYRWYLGNGYVCRHERIAKRQYRGVYLHRLVAGAPEGDRTVQVHHEDGDRLNNQRANLLLLSRKAHSEEHRGDRLVNRYLQRNFQPPRSRSGFKGVCWHRHNHLWVAQIVIGHRNVQLGYFGSPEEAARAYDAAVREYRLGYGYLNFPGDVQEQPAGESGEG
jgi:hypothetical protein